MSRSQHFYVPMFQVCPCDLLVTYLHSSHYNLSAHSAITVTSFSSYDTSVLLVSVMLVSVMSAGLLEVASAIIVVCGAILLAFLN